MTPRLFALVDETRQWTFGYLLLDGDALTITDSLDDVPPALRAPRTAITIMEMFRATLRVALGSAEAESLLVRTLRGIAP